MSQTEQTPSVRDGLMPEELDAQQVAELPERQAMSLISTDPSASMLTGYEGTADDLGLTGTTTGDAGTSDAVGSTAAGATDLANDAATEADASGSEPPAGSVTSTDRSEQITQSDTATATS